MDYIDTLIKSIKSPEFDKIMIFIYSNFIIGYLILFTTYEKSFLNLEFSTQIILSIGISFPISLFSAILWFNSFKRKKNEKVSVFYQLAHEYVCTIFIYSGLFSIFYLAKHSNLIPHSGLFLIFYNPIIALPIIMVALFICARLL
jgi:hypothetical protein